MNKKNDNIQFKKTDRLEYFIEHRNNNQRKEYLKKEKSCILMILISLIGWGVFALLYWFIYSFGLKNNHLTREAVIFLNFVLTIMYGITIIGNFNYTISAYKIWNKLRYIKKIKSYLYYIVISIFLILFQLIILLFFTYKDFIILTKNADASAIISSASLIVIVLIMNIFGHIKNNNY